MTDFQVRLVPGLTADDTRFEAQGTWSRPNKGLESSVEAGGAAIRWAKEHGWERPGDVTLWAAQATDVFTAAAGTPQVTLSPVALEHFVGDNRRGDPTGPPAKYTADLSTAVTDSSSAEWSHSESTSVGFTLGVEIGFEGDKASASTSVSFDVSDGQSHSTSHEVQVGTSVGVELEAPGGVCLLAVLLLQRGTVTGAVHFAGRTVGNCLVGYRPDSPLYAPLDRPPVPVKVEDLGLSQVHTTVTIRRAFAADSQIVTADIPDNSPTTVDDGITGIVKGAEDPNAWVAADIQARFPLGAAMDAGQRRRVPITADGPPPRGRDLDAPIVSTDEDPRTGIVEPLLTFPDGRLVASRPARVRLPLPHARRLWHDLGDTIRRLEADGDPTS